MLNFVAESVHWLTSFFEHSMQFAAELFTGKVALGVVIGFTINLIQKWLTAKGYSKHATIGLFAAGVVALAYLFWKLAYEPHVEMINFVGFLVLWGIAVYVVICEILLFGTAKRLNKSQPRGRWIREIEYIT